MSKSTTNWTTIGGSNMGMDIKTLLMERSVNMIDQFHSPGSNGPIVPEGNENFVKRTNVFYPWNNRGPNVVHLNNSDYTNINADESSPNKRIIFSDSMTPKKSKTNFIF